MRRLLTLPILLGGLALTACAQPRYYARVPPPPVREVYGVAPSPGVVWVPGYYTYGRNAYTWVPGRWVRPPRPRSVWVPGYWRQHRGNYHFVPGRWR